MTKLLPPLNRTPPLTITDPIAAFTGLLWNNIDSNGYLYFLIQLYLLPELKRNRKKGYGRIVAERPTGSRAGCQSASGGSRTPRPVRTTVRPKPTSHHQKTPLNPIGDPAEACQGWLLADKYLQNYPLINFSISFQDYLSPALVPPWTLYLAA